MENKHDNERESENITKNVNKFSTRYEDANFVDTSKAVWNYSILYDDDIAYFQNGSHYSLYKKFGSKRLTVLNREGYHFCVWAPNATKVSVVGRSEERRVGKWY